jgi:hypothetical protein
MHSKLRNCVMPSFAVLIMFLTSGYSPPPPPPLLTPINILDGCQTVGFLLIETCGCSRPNQTQQTQDKQVDL